MTVGLLAWASARALGSFEKDSRPLFLAPLFLNNLPNPLVVVPAGSFIWSRKGAAWNPIHLPKPFFYNGRDNLTIEIRYQGGELSGSTASW